MIPYGSGEAEKPLESERTNLPGDRGFGSQQAERREAPQAAIGDREAAPESCFPLQALLTLPGLVSLPWSGLDGQGKPFQFFPQSPIFFSLY